MWRLIYAGVSLVGIVVGYFAAEEERQKTKKELENDILLKWKDSKSDQEEDEAE